MVRKERSPGPAAYLIHDTVGKLCDIEKRKNEDEDELDTRKC